MAIAGVGVCLRPSPRPSPHADGACGKLDDARGEGVSGRTSNRRAPSRRVAGCRAMRSSGRSKSNRSVRMRGQDGVSTSPLIYEFPPGREALSLGRRRLLLLGGRRLRRRGGRWRSARCRPQLAPPARVAASAFRPRCRRDANGLRDGLVQDVEQHLLRGCLVEAGERAPSPRTLHLGPERHGAASAPAPAATTLFGSSAGRTC